MMSWQIPTDNYGLEDRGYEAPRSYHEPPHVSNNNQYVTYLKEESNEGVRM